MEMNKGRLDGTSTEADIALASFPSVIHDDVRRILASVDEPEYSTHLSGLRLLVRGEYLEPPARIYWAEPTAEMSAGFSTRELRVLSSYFTRHHDGYVRERHLRNLLAQRLDDWSVPYVLWLLGEYVREICDVIAEQAPAIDLQLVEEFARNNPEFVKRLRRQVISYWSCYWRGSVRLLDYPGFVALRSLGLWHGTEGRKAVRRGW